MDEFAHCFSACARVYVLDIYAASEPPIAGVSSQRLVERMWELGFEGARYVPSEQEVIQGVLQEARPGDLVVTIGAGSVWKVAEALVKSLQTLRATRSEPVQSG
jgi:UDP-N-acetylmuramate--alanine ligase